MRRDHLVYLRCPRCHGRLELQSHSPDGERVEAGALVCVSCAASFPLLGGVPRFVPVQNEASSFGLEWTRHARTQYDSHSGIGLSEQRFFAETRWPRHLEGQVIVEAGGGSGRFTEQAAATGAMVLSLDYSYAVEANYASNSARPNVLIVQADLHHMPFAPGRADKLFCFGVLQHTPDPHRAFLCLHGQLKPGGSLVVDVYKKDLLKWVLGTKYWVRPLSRRLPPERLYRGVRRYVDFMWPLCSQLRRLPRLGAAINWRLLVADYSRLDLDPELLKEWAYLDTFDMLAPRYDAPQTAATLRTWCAEAGLENVEVGDGYNGIEARGTRPAAAGQEPPRVAGNQRP